MSEVWIKKARNVSQAITDTTNQKIPRPCCVFRFPKTLTTKSTNQMFCFVSSYVCLTACIVAARAPISFTLSTATLALSWGSCPPVSCLRRLLPLPSPSNGIYMLLVHRSSCCSWGRCQPCNALMGRARTAGKARGTWEDFLKATSEKRTDFYRHSHEAMGIALKALITETISESIAEKEMESWIEDRRVYARSATI